MPLLLLVDYSFGGAGYYFDLNVDLYVLAWYYRHH